MITLHSRKTGEPTRTYKCDPKTQIELCFANIECLLHIALADSDKHIRELGGEETLLNLMFGYERLAETIRDEWLKNDDTGKSKEV